MYKRYEKYKDSGVKWIGEIPTDWDTLKLKYILKSLESGSRETGGGNTGSGVFSIGGEHISWEGDVVTFPLKYISEEYYNNLNSGKVKIGDTLLVKDGATIGKTAFVGLMPFEKCAVNEHVYILRSNSNNLPKLLYYLISGILCLEQIRLEMRGAAQPGLNYQFADKVKVPLIPENVQKALVLYLDQKTSEIDSLIADKEELIKRLEKYKQSIITEAVTKGLNPDVKIKDSGIEWIGTVPEHWVVTKLKRLTRQIIDGTHLTPTYTDKSVPFLRVTDITKSLRDNIINLDEVKYISHDEHRTLSKRCNPKKGDLLLSKNGTIGIPKVVDWDYEFSIFVSLCLIKVKNIIDIKFLKYYFESDAVNEQIAYGGKTNTITNLHLDKIREFYISLPPIHEQEEIVANLDKTMNEISFVSNIVQAQINNLKAYRQSLIFEAVTGKIDVRDYQSERSEQFA